jgi:hypothetical protein
VCTLCVLRCNGLTVNFLCDLHSGLRDPPHPPHTWALAVHLASLRGSGMPPSSTHWRLWIGIIQQRFIREDEAMRVRAPLLGGRTTYLAPTARQSRDSVDRCTPLSSCISLVPLNTAGLPSLPRPRSIVATFARRSDISSFFGGTVWLGASRRLHPSCHPGRWLGGAAHRMASSLCVR